MDKKIENILNLYENILSNKPTISEADIQGVDELVYNPATGKGGTIGYGYDGGNKKENLKWNGHDNHLHIGFTDKKVAMDIIDKAHSMGLKTTENPYAKKDPNGKVDNVHTGGSLHYQNFPGVPLVGKAVDISGDSNKITELINWVNQNYAGVTSTGDITKKPTSTDGDIKDPLMYQIVQNMSKSLFPDKMTESISFGKNIKNLYGGITIPKDSNTKIKSPVSGVVDNSKYSSGCKNQITIKTNDKKPKFLQFCGISYPIVQDGDTIFEGQILGKTDDDVKVTLFNSSFRKESLKSFNKTSKDVDFDDNRKTSLSTNYKDPLLSALVQLPFKPFQKKVNENVERIKKLL